MNWTRTRQRNLFKKSLGISLVGILALNTPFSSLNRVYANQPEYEDEEIYTDDGYISGSYGDDGYTGDDYYPGDGYADDLDDPTQDGEQTVDNDDQDQQPILISQWEWNDEDGILSEADGFWYLGLPGADRSDLTEENLLPLLPESIAATTSDGEIIDDIPVTWDLTDLEQEEETEFYLLNAVLPEEYQLDSYADLMQVFLECGGVSTNAEEFLYTANSKARENSNQSNSQTVHSEEDISNWNTINLEKYQVKSIQPDNVTVNLFNYKVNHADGENDAMATPTMPTVNDQKPKPETEDVWNKGINQNSLLLFGNSMTDVGYWNNGAGAGRPWGKNHTNMKGIVNNTLNANGYPQINLENAIKPLNDQTPTQWEKEIKDGKVTYLDTWGLGCADYAKGANDYNSKTGYSAGGLSTNLLNKQKSLTEDQKRASLQYLFDPSISVDDASKKSYKESYQNVKNLFQIDEDGYYYYDVRKNFAHFVESSTGEQSEQPSDGTFVLYNSPAVIRTDGGYQCADGGLACDTGNFNGAKSRGNFFPFNSPQDVYDQIATNSNGQKVLWSGNPKRNEKGEIIVGSKTNEGNAVRADHHMGMTVEVDFSQPINGLVNRGSSAAEPMKFEFSGDDDVWVFIDDVLVLDIGGIHSELYGTIDFSTGAVEIGQSWRTNGDIDAAHELFAESLDSHVDRTTLFDLFSTAGKADSVSWNGDTFASNSTHKLKMFYLERGNYDSSLKLRFNLQTPKPHEIIKVDQNGDPLATAEFALYPAHETTLEQDPNSIRCLNATQASSTNPVYVAQIVDGAAGSQPLATLTTARDGTATFMEPAGQSDDTPSTAGEQRPFNFADRYKTDAHGNVISGQYYILKETTAPNGYRPLPQDIVLEYDPNTTMLRVANRWGTGAHASFTSTIAGIKSPKIVGSPSSASVDDQKDGLVVAVPALTQTPGNDSNDDWAGVYGTNLDGFHTIAREEGTSEKENLLKAALYQAYLTLNQDQHSALQQHWYLEWNDTNDRLEGVLRNLPGSADRYALLNNENADLKMNYYLITPQVFSDEENYPTAADKYRWLGTLVKNKLANADPTDAQIIAAVNAVMEDFTSEDQTLENTKLLDTGDFSRTFRSLIYIPNEQRELRIQKIDQNGTPVKEVKFALYTDKNAEGTPVATGVTDENGQLVFMPKPPTEADGKVSDGYAKITWNEAKDTPQYYLRETECPAGYEINNAIVPIVVGDYGIYADAGDENNGVSVMAGVGQLTQTMVKYASDGEINVTLQDITSICQTKLSGDFTKPWTDDLLTISGNDSATAIPRSMNLHYGVNQVVDYGLHDEDGGKNIRPFFVTDTGFIRSRVIQNQDLEYLDNQYPEEHQRNNTRRDDLGDADLTPLFRLLNTVVITNEKKDPDPMGKLTIRKVITGTGLNDSDYNDTFHFKVNLNDINGQPLTGVYYYFYGDNKAGTITDNGELSLKHDEAVTIRGLPEGTQWTITEILDEGSKWHPAFESATGTIEAKKTDLVEFKNYKEIPPVGNLEVSKTVAGNDLDKLNADKSKDFHFTVKLINKPITGTFGEMEFREGVAEFTLKDGEKKTAKGLPKDTEYSVSEAEADQDWYKTIVAVNGTPQTDKTASGTISADQDATVAFTNTRNIGKLIVSKTVGGSMGDKTKEFDFTLTLINAEKLVPEKGLSYTLTTKSSSGQEDTTETKTLSFDLNGVASFTLKHNQTFTTTLPEGAEFVVTENDYSSDGYKTTVSAVDSKVTIEPANAKASGTISTSNIEVAYTNTKDGKPVTGIDDQNPAWMIAAAGGAALIAVLLLMKKYRYEKE